MKHRIVVLGAGYAGANAAGRLARRLHPDDTEIIVVNAEPDFVERVRLHQLATGQRLRRRPLSDVFAGTGITIRQGRVVAVDVANGSVELAGGDVLTYEKLIYALGSTTAVGENAYHVGSRAAALRLSARLSETKTGTILLVGGGLTGIEAATEIAEARPDLRVAITDRGEAGGWLSDRARAHLRKTFARLGITVHNRTDVVRVEDDGVITGTGERIPAAVTVWTSGFATHPIAAASGLEVTGAGRIVVDASMRSVSHPDVYAVGDAAVTAGAGGKPLRMSCASGIPMAWQAADAIAARLTGREVSPSPIRYFTQCISLGRTDGIVQFVTPDDQPKSSLLTGWAAARTKEMICSGAAWSPAHPTLMLPTRRRRVAVG